MRAARSEIGVETQNRVLRMVLAAPGGMSTDDVIKASGLSRGTCNNMLQALGDEGRLASTHRGAGALWCHPSRAADLYDEIRAAIAARAKSKQARSELRKREEEADAWASAKPKRTIIPAHEAPPIRPARPASVFDLGDSTWN